MEADNIVNYSEPLSTSAILADFNDMFLTDGMRQLRIAYNPKVSSFKTTLLEQKTDTLGSKYPTFSRNGIVNYVELNLSGLISYTADLHHYFYTPTRNFETMYNLTAHNFYQERIFKTEVLAWLTNGEPKLFRSPGEGNFIVRLMNISLSPNDTLGRMLHTFTATAYEIAKSDIDSLIERTLLPFAQHGLHAITNKSYTTSIPIHSST
jgi:hypothetical protein